MSQFTTSKEPHKAPSTSAKWSIRDTEFLIRLIMSSKIDGQDLEIAAETVKKIKELHASIVGHKVSI
jgi:hypothetical protein